MSARALISRPPRWLILVFLAVLIIYLGLGLSATQSTGIAAFSHSLADYTRKLSSGSLDTNIHRTRNPNDFFPHFRKVLDLPPLTIEQAQEGCQWPADEKVPFQFSAGETGFVNASWVTTSPPNEEIIEVRKIWHDFMKQDLLAWDQLNHRYSGKGVVIVGGNGKTAERIKTQLRQLNRLGSKIAVELHYWDHEMNATIRADLSAIRDVHFNDLSKPTNTFGTSYSMFWQNFQMKSAAVLNSRFAEVLLLDSDNVPAIAPEELFASATYREYGTVFWGDIARTRPNNPTWAITNTVCRMDEWEQESGQMMVDKSRFFYHLQLPHFWSNNYMPYWNNILLGDKDLFRFAWHSLKTQYGRPRKFLASVGMQTPPREDGTALYCGHTFAQHHPDDARVAFLHGGLYKSQARQILSWARKERGGTFQATKQVGTDDPRVNFDIHLVGDGGEYLPDEYKPIERPSVCADIEGVQPEPFDDVLPGFEEVWEEIGGYWMLDDPRYAGIPI